MMILGSLFRLMMGCVDVVAGCLLFRFEAFEKFRMPYRDTLKSLLYF